MNYLRGRFDKEADRLVGEYSVSIGYDRRLASCDVKSSLAHAAMLARQGIISGDEAVQIKVGLVEIAGEIAAGAFPYRTEFEDIHMNIEARLTEKIGAVAGKLHTARSRNDQVATDLRLFTRDAVNDTLKRIGKLQRALLGQAEANIDAVMPGYTHLQPAQPVLLAHHLLAYFEMLARDKGRFADCLKRSDVMPLGSGALAGVAHPVDRESVAKELGFAAITQNSMDAVSDRDFVIEYEAAAATCMMHISRLSEEIILWSTAEFAFVNLDDSYATSSSIMPQKKNPDIAELARGKTGRVYGSLMAMLTVMKGLPLTYNRDLQEDKEGFFNAVDTLLNTLDVMAGMVATITFNHEAMMRATRRGYLLATDLADYLVRSGEPFREAHQIVARLVNYAEDKGKDLDALTVAEYREFSERFDEDILEIDAAASLAARNHCGGTAKVRVKQALAEAGKTLPADES
jgi:argininosuccinate lyase